MMRVHKKTLLWTAAIVLIFLLIYFEFFYLSSYSRQSQVWTAITEEEALEVCPSLAYSDEMHQWMLELLETTRDNNLEIGYYSLKDFELSSCPVEGATDSYVQVEYFADYGTNEIYCRLCSAIFIFMDDQQVKRIVYHMGGTNSDPIEILDEYMSVGIDNAPKDDLIRALYDTCYYANYTEGKYKIGEMRHEWFWLIKREIKSFLYR